MAESTEDFGLFFYVRTLLLQASAFEP